jgi:hypothetical protein
MSNLKARNQFVNGVIASGGRIKLLGKGAAAIWGPGEVGMRHLFEIIDSGGNNWDVDFIPKPDSGEERQALKFTRKTECYNFILDKIAESVKEETPILAMIVDKYRTN